MKKKQSKPFELFFLEELLNEGIISKELFDVTYQQLVDELKEELNEKGRSL